jgi:Ca2+-binding RTX toxin-like protein
MDIFGTSGNDDLRGTQSDDVFHLTQGGNDIARGRAGNDVFEMGNRFTAADSLDGGDGFDAVDVTGSLTATFTAATVTRIELLNLGGGFYDITVDDANVAAGATMVVRCTGEELVFYGGAETDGSFVLKGGSGKDWLLGGTGDDRISGNAGRDTLHGHEGDDVLIGGIGANHFTGGFGADEIRCGKSVDTFRYVSGLESSSTTHDTVVKLDADEDRFDVDLAVTNVEAKSGTLNTATFDSDMGTAINDWTGAVVLTVTGGDLIGHTYLVIDANGNVSYDAGTDHVIDITGYSGTLDTGDFV